MSCVKICVVLLTFIYFTAQIIYICFGYGYILLGSTIYIQFILVGNYICILCILWYKLYECAPYKETYSTEIYFLCIKLHELLLLKGKLQRSKFILYVFAYLYIFFFRYYMNWVYVFLLYLHSYINVHYTIYNVHVYHTSYCR